MNLRNRSYTKELLDGDDIPFEDIKRNMEELNFINQWLGGHKITISGIKQLINKKKEIAVCEIGCGGGDNLSAIVKTFSNKISIRCIGIDIKDECIAFARENKTLKHCAEWITSDYSKVSFTAKPDIIFSSLFCHHFTEEELVFMLRWMQQKSRIGFFINDLHRHWLAYYSIKLLTKIFSKSYLVKNDAPLSVQRGFTRKEWNTLFQEAGIHNFNCKWRWAFRWLITSHAIE